MHNRIRVFALMIGLCTTILSGCAPSSGPGMGETEEKVREAESYVDAVKQVNAEEFYPSDFDMASQEFSRAKDYLRSGKVSDAYSAAGKSLLASNRILKQIFIDEVANLARDLKNDIEVTKQENPDTLVQDFLPQLDNILTYADTILENPDMEVSLIAITDFTQQVAEIDTAINTMSEEILKSDLAFAPGEYVLSDDGQRALQQFVDEILTKKDQKFQHASSKAISIKVEVLGFTDQMGFRRGTTLRTKLLEGIEQLVPKDAIGERRLLNRRLAEFRAASVSDYIMRLLEESAREDLRVELKPPVVVGRGEEIPSGMTITYSLTDSVSDPQRRMCKISSYVIAK